jgi:hypothetical protein
MLCPRIKIADMWKNKSRDLVCNTRIVVNQIILRVFVK